MYNCKCILESLQTGVVIQRDKDRCTNYTALTLLTSSTQVAPFWQGCDEHSLTRVEQMGSVKSGRHRHVKLFTPATQLNNSIDYNYCSAWVK